MSRMNRKPEPKTFKLFLCTECLSLYEDKDNCRWCMHCDSNQYIARYVCEESVKTKEEAYTFYIADMCRERDKLTRILEGIKIKENL